jgi:hypothetical protein
LDVWSTQRGVADGVVGEIVRIPRRELSRSVREYRRRSKFDADELECCVLNEEQVLDLAEDVAREEIGLACDTDKGAFSRKTSRHELNDLSLRVVHAIEERPRPVVHRRSVMWITGGFILGLLAFVSALESDDVASRMVPMFIVPLVLTLVCVVVVLFWQRFHVRDGYDEVEFWLHANVEWSNMESERVSSRLSRYARVRRMHAVLARQRQLGASTQSIKNLKEKQGLLLERMDSVATVVGEPELNMRSIESVARGSWGIEGLRLEDKDFYCAVRASASECQFNPELNDLRTIDVPFAFVDAFTLLPLRVFEEGE